MHDSMQYDERGAAVARVWVAMPQIRTDRRKVGDCRTAWHICMTVYAHAPNLHGKKCTPCPKSGIHRHQVLGDKAMRSGKAMQDRVEASPEQLAQASAVAEQFSEASKRRTRVIGW